MNGDLRRWAVTSILGGAVMTMTHAAEIERPRRGDWVRYRVVSASEWTPAAVDIVDLVLGPRVEIDGQSAWTWRMTGTKDDGSRFAIDVVSEDPPMIRNDGEIGEVFSYAFRQGDRPPLVYADAHTGRPFLPMFGFRSGLVPTPRTPANRAGPFLGTGAYLGQLLAAQQWGRGRAFDEPGAGITLRLDDDLLVGTARMSKDDGTGQDEDLEYTYVELDAGDYDAMIAAGFNLFIVNGKHADHVRDRAVFFVQRRFGADGYPELLYRSNYRGPAMFADEPAIRLNTAECRSIHDAAALLRLRNHAYFRMPGSLALDPRLTQADGIVRMVEETKFNVGDWEPRQTHVPVWETIHESAFYQLQGGAAGIVHEGRYRLADFNGHLQHILGPGIETDVRQMLDITYGFMRGAARCFGGDWGTAIYGQADDSIAPEAIRQAYDRGARYIWFWTSDHDHHLPWRRQLELARVIRAHQAQHPRSGRDAQLRAARVAVAVPDGYLAGGGFLWNNPLFHADKANEHGVRYGDVVREAYWQMVRLIDQGTPFDCIVDVPVVIDQAGYERIIRVTTTAGTDLPAPTLSALPVSVRIEPGGAGEAYEPRADAPRATARLVEPGRVRIDARLDEWDRADWIELELPLMYEIGHQRWAGPRDLSARAAFAYDGDAVYIAAEVVDDIMTAGERGDLIWLNDCIQIAFDPLFNPHAEGAYAMDDVEIGFSLVDGEPYAHQWHSGGLRQPGALVGAEVAIRRRGNITVYEARVPFASLAPLSPGFPGRCGMNVAVNDADDGLRKGALAWTAGLVDGKNPSRFGVLEFADADALPEGLPVIFVQPERTVVRRGEDVLLRIDTGSRRAATARLELALTSGNLRGPIARADVAVPVGMHHALIRVATAGLPSAGYRAEVVLRADDREAFRRTLWFGVLGAGAGP